VVLAFAAWQPARRARARIESWVVLFLPQLLALTSVAVLLYDHFRSVNAIAVVLASASLAAVVARLGLTYGENMKMLSVSRHEALTDPLTGLGNRRKLARDIEDRLAAEGDGSGTVLLLSDLDGFKSYNDTFGHPAGDALLVQLGKRLAEVGSIGGEAYRMGGDEFCILVPANTEPAVASAFAERALSAQGERFSIGASHGWSRLPEEADEPTAALRLADRRLYAAKASRGSAGRQSADVLLRALAERDAALGAHVSVVGELAERVGAGLGLPEERLRQLRQAAELHDVGKVAIPDAILGKPGPLDEHEWQFLHRHTLVGERILAAAPALDGVAALVRSTHERFDGKGYPDQLAGAAIPLEARVVAVCDAYDAMLTDRPYRAPRSRDEALAELDRCAGTQFDPDVVAVFAAVVDDVECGRGELHADAA
jgi:diguanylate cyclase (GGDEF)-like protein